MDFTYLAKELGIILTISIFLVAYLIKYYLDVRSANNKLRYQIQFKGIHDKKAEFLKDIYSNFYELETNLEKFSVWKSEGIPLSLQAHDIIKNIGKQEI